VLLGKHDRQPLVPELLSAQRALDFTPELRVRLEE